jgi:hypothetical protein
MIVATNDIRVEFVNVACVTNADNFLSFNANASIVTYVNCFLNPTNADGMSIAGNSSSNIFLKNCFAEVGDTFRLFATTSPLMWIDTSAVQGSSVASTSSTGNIRITNSELTHPFATSSGGVISASNSKFGHFQTPFTDITYITTAGTGTSFVEECEIYSGTASAISVGAGTTVECYNTVLNSSNTNVITGAGTLKYSGLSFTGSSSLINVTTQTGGTLQGGRFQAPSAGFLGEQIRAFVDNGAPVSIATNTATNLTSISLTAGIWDVSAVIVYSGLTTGTRVSCNISTASATLGTVGDNRVDFPISTTTNSDAGLTIPAYRLTLTATTTVYAVGFCTYTVGTGTMSGRISATRVA